MSLTVTVTCTVRNCANDNKICNDKDLVCRREVAVNVRQDPTLPVTFHLLFSFGKSKVFFKIHHFNNVLITAVLPEAYLAWLFLV
jgi:hypothetical protein